MKALFEFLSGFDWISPAIETAKDIAYTAETGELATPLTVANAYDAQARLEAAGVTVVSITRGWNGDFVDVPDDEADKARAILGL